MTEQSVSLSTSPVRRKPAFSYRLMAGWLAAFTHRPTLLIALVKARLKPMQYRPSLLDGFLAKTGLDLTLS
jgi:hypothetical protein